jgi:predicted nucleotidyltransferase
MEEHKLLFKVRVGSFLYGLNTPSSDEDYMSVIMPSPKDLLGLQKLEEIDNSSKSSAAGRRNTEEDVDDKQYTLPRYLNLFMNGNPEKTEVLFAEPKNILVTSPEMQFLFDNREKIISKRVLHSFSGFAHAQKSKLIVKKERYFSLIAAVEWIEKNISKERLGVDNQTTSLTEVESDILNKTVKYYKGSKNNVESFHKGMAPKMIYEKLISERDNYGWRVHTETFNRLFYDVKFGYHLVRLLSECRQLLETGKITYPFTGKAFNDIMRIRNGEVSYEELMEMYISYEEAIKPFETSNVLRDKPDFNFVNDWLIETLLGYFKE